MRKRSRNGNTWVWWPLKLVDASVRIVDCDRERMRVCVVGGLIVREWVRYGNWAWMHAWMRLDDFMCGSVNESARACFILGC